MNARSEANLEEGVDFLVRKGHWLPRKLNVECVAFGKTLYLRDSNGRIPNHEYMHLLQFRKHGTPVVVAHYLLHFFRNCLAHKNLGIAFQNIPFEVEARHFENERGRYR